MYSQTRPTPTLIAARWTSDSDLRNQTVHVATMKMSSGGMRRAGGHTERLLRVFWERRSWPDQGRIPTAGLVMETSSFICFILYQAQSAIRIFPRSFLSFCTADECMRVFHCGVSAQMSTCNKYRTQLLRNDYIIVLTADSYVHNESSKKKKKGPKRDS